MSCITIYLRKIIKFKMGVSFAARMAKIVDFIFICSRNYFIRSFSVKSFSIMITDVAFFTIMI